MTKRSAIDWQEYEDRSLRPAFKAGDGRATFAVVHMPRHSKDWHVIIWDATDEDGEDDPIIDTEMIINHPGWATPEGARGYAEAWFDEVQQ